MTARRLPAAGALMLCAAIVLLTLVPVVFGRPRPMVQIAWRGVGTAERAAVEKQFQLTEARETGAGRWAYVPLDTSRIRLRALVLDPRVADTDGIDRRSFRIAKRGPLTERRGGLIAWPFGARLARLAAYLLAGAGVALLAASAWLRTRGTRPTASRASGLSEWLERGVPVASPHAAGLFRIVFGSLVLVYVASNPVYPALLDPYELGRAAGAYGSLTGWLAEHTRVVEWLDRLLKALGLLFVVGAGTFVVYPAFVAAFLLWACVYTLGVSPHVVSALGVALICLLPARWADAWSVDAWMWPSRAAAPPSKRYGFAIWVPVLVAGCAFLAAAVSKLGQGGDWILNGTVKYHFVSDLDHAWVTWGPRLMRHDAAAIPVSAAVVVLEALIVTAAFSRSTAYRLTMGAFAAAMLAGFAVFQGVVWPGWWILLLGFLPWERVRAATVSGGAPMPVAQRTAAAAVLLVQFLASTTRIEARPVVSAYDMYSTTYADDEEYEQASNLRYRVLAVRRDGSTSDLGCTLEDRAALVLADAGKGDRDAQGRITRMLDACLGGRRDVEYVKLEGERQVFDWDTSQFAWKRGLQPIGPVPIAWLRKAEEHVAR